VTLRSEHVDSSNTYGSSNTTTDNGSSQYTSTGAGSNTHGSASGAGYETGTHHGSSTGAGGYGTGSSTGTSGLNSGSGYETGTHHGSSTTGSGAYSSGAGTGHRQVGESGQTVHDAKKGPMDVSEARALDDRSGSNTASGYGSSNTGSRTANAGPHDSKLANKLDPRVDSDLGKHMILEKL
jgi:hypothetical protein